MCNKASYIITEEGTLYIPGVDSHSEILRLSGIRDDGRTCPGVKCEMQVNWDSWEDPQTWKFVVDQDQIPDWFDYADAEREGRRIAQRIIDNGEWTFGGNLWLSRHNNFTSLPEGLYIGGKLEAIGCAKLKALPKHLHVDGNIDVRDCTSLESIPDNIHVGGGLYLGGCISLRSLPDNLRVRGNLDLRECAALKFLPNNLQVDGSLFIGDCPKITSLPDTLRIGRALYLSGVTHTKISSEEIFILRKKYNIADLYIRSLPCN
jgi:hypothetical protein